jgi:hypothetical protein
MVTSTTPALCDVTHIYHLNMLCSIGLVVTFPSISREYGSLITRAAYSFKFTSFIMLCSTFRRFCTFSCKNLSDLDGPSVLGYMIRAFNVEPEPSK